MKRPFYYLFEKQLRKSVCFEDAGEIIIKTLGEGILFV
jgi:hypothetical protein